MFSRQIAVPSLPSKARYVGLSGGAEAATRVPPADEADLAGLEYSDRQRLMKERSEAAGLDRGHAKVECLSQIILSCAVGAAHTPLMWAWLGHGTGDCMEFFIHGECAAG